MKHITVTVAAALLLAPFVAPLSMPLAAQDNRPAARDVVKKWQEAVVNVRVVLKMRMSMGGREMQASDDPVDTVGTVIDPSGLTVLSLGSLNPGAMMSKLMGAGGGNGQPGVEITSEPTDVKIRLSNGRELPAKIVLRDEDLDLAFLRPTTKPDTPLVALDLTDAAKPALLDQVLVLSRLGRVGGWTAGAALFDIGAIIEKPRTFYVLAGASSGMGTPGLPDQRPHRRAPYAASDRGRPRQHGVDDGRVGEHGSARGDPAGRGCARDCEAGAGEIRRLSPEP